MSRVDFAYHDYSIPDPPHQPLYLERLVRLLESSPGVNDVLDAGCGDGNFTASLAENGFRMHGLDLSSGGIAKARERWPKVKFAEASVYDDLLAPFHRTDPFDAVVTVEVIEHLYTPRTFCNRVHAALKPGGLFIITTPYWGYLKNIVLAVTDRMDRALTPLWEGGHIKHWSYRTLRTLGEDHGFEFITFEGAGRPVPFLWNGMVMAFRKPLAS